MTLATLGRVPPNKGIDVCDKGFTSYMLFVESLFPVALHIVPIPRVMHTVRRTNATMKDMKKTRLELCDVLHNVRFKWRPIMLQPKNIVVLILICFNQSIVIGCAKKVCQVQQTRPWRRIEAIFCKDETRRRDNFHMPPSAKARMIRAWKWEGNRNVVTRATCSTTRKKKEREWRRRGKEGF